LISEYFVTVTSLQITC